MSSDIRPVRSIVEESQEGSDRHNVLDYDHVVRFTDGDTTPSVANLTRFSAVGSATITNFDHGAEGQRVHIKGNGSTIISHNATIRRSWLRNDILEDEKIYSFEYIGGVWYEDVDRWGVQARKDGGSTVGPRRRLNFIEGTGIDIAVSDDAGSEEIDVQITATGGMAPAPHAVTHEDGGTDEIDVTGLSGLLADSQTPLAHKTSHENGGSDEINVAGLSGELADPQPPKAHKTSHENGGGDEISISGLSGETADAQKVTVRKNSGADVGTRKRLNFIEGTNVTLTVTDDAGGSEVDVEIAASGGGGGGAGPTDTYAWMPLTTVVGGVPELVWDGDDSLIPTLVTI